ncbi:WD repeat-containing protein VIP3 [Tanacetum coccineum]
MKLVWLRSVEPAHQDCVWACTWVPPTDTSPKTLLLTGSLDETVKLWDPSSEGEVITNVRTNTGHCLGVVSVAAHPSGKIAASASMDSFVRVFDVESNVTIATLEAPPSEVWHMQFDPRAVESTVHTIGSSEEEFCQLKSVDFYWQGTTLAVAGGSSASVKLWDTAEWKQIGTLSIPRPEGSKASDKGNNKKFVLSVAWSPNGRQLACGSMDGSISVFDVQRAKFLHHLEGHTMPVRSLAYSPLDPRVLVSGSDDERIHMYDPKERHCFRRCRVIQVWYEAYDVSPEGQLLHRVPVI